MIVGGYSLMLYCRYSKVSRGPSKEFDAVHWGKCGEFDGETRRECVRDAKAAGWVFYRRDVTCPSCAKSRPTPARDGERPMVTGGGLIKFARDGERDEKGGGRA